MALLDLIRSSGTIIFMCNLYSATMPVEAMRQLFDVTSDRDQLGNAEPLTAIYPKYRAPIVAVEDGDRFLTRARWGFLTPNKSKKTGKWLKPQAWNNTRDDGIRSHGLWKDSFVHRRCLIPATAYAEATGRNPSTFHWFRLKDADAFAFAGIWKYQKGSVGETDVDDTFYSMVTTKPNDFAAKYHNRMPLILSPDDYDQWLHGDEEAAAKLLQPSPSTQMHLIASGEGLRSEPEQPRNGG